MPSGSLLDRLSCLDGTPPLSWYLRCKIAQGEANGLSYLHENHHIHRDIKSANILLDEDFTVKIYDFGLARASEKFAQSVMTSRIVGTTAYMTPEALWGEITPKSDHLQLWGGFTRNDNRTSSCGWTPWTSVTAMWVPIEWCACAERRIYVQSWECVIGSAAEEQTSLCRKPSKGCYWACEMNAQKHKSQEADGWMFLGRRYVWMY